MLQSALTAIMILAAFMVLILGVFLVIRTVVRAVGRSATFFYEKYRHHGDTEVWVRTDLKGLHRDFCLCYACKRFHPGSTANCNIAQAIYKNCILHNVVTPVWECPRFAREPNVKFIVTKPS